MNTATPQPTHEQQEAFLVALAAALDHEESAVAKTTVRGGKGKAETPAMGLFSGGYGLVVTAILRAAGIAGIPWGVIITQVLPDVQAMRREHKGVGEIITTVVKKWLTGGYEDAPAAPAPPPA